MKNISLTEKLEAIEYKLVQMERTLSGLQQATGWTTSTTMDATDTQTTGEEARAREWYTPKQFAEELGYAPKYVYNLIGKGALSTQKVKGRRKVLIHRTELVRFIGDDYRPSAEAERERAAIEAYNKLTKKK